MVFYQKPPTVPFTQHNYTVKRFLAHWGFSSEEELKEG
jgi:hypothetical protein